MAIVSSKESRRDDAEAAAVEVGVEGKAVRGDEGNGEGNGENAVEEEEEKYSSCDCCCDCCGS